MNLTERSIEFFVLQFTHQMSPDKVSPYVMACAKLAFAHALDFYNEKAHEERMALLNKEVQR